MRTQLQKLALPAILVLAITFTFSCSGGDDDGGNSGGTCHSDKGNNIANYKITEIGSQTWMAENLNYNVASSKCYGESGKEMYYGDGNVNYRTLSNSEIEANGSKYGRLYTWATAMALPSNCDSSSCASQISAKHRGICPSGWHIPSDEEWTKLTDFVGGSSTAGKYLKATSGWSGSRNGTDDYGFSALPGGNCIYKMAGECSDYCFMNVDDGNWWSSTEYKDNAANGAAYRFIRSDNVNSGTGAAKHNLLSVRCVKD